MARFRHRSQAVLAFALVFAGCGRTRLLPSDLQGDARASGGDGTAQGGSGAGDLSAAGGVTSSSTTSGGTTSDSTTSGGVTSTQGGGGAGGVGSIDGGSTGESVVDRCLDPGPPPADGAEDGSEYQFGFTVHLAKDSQHQIAVADLDRDGRPDLLGSEPSRPLVTYRQIVRGTFDVGREASSVTDSGRALGLHVIDLDGVDGPDAVVARDEGLSVFENNGSGAMHSAVTIGELTLSAPTSWDVDGDGDSDVLALATDPTDTEPSGLAIYENDAGSLEFRRSVPFPFRATALRVADVTGDSIPEVLVLRQTPARVSVFEQLDFEELVTSNEITASGSTEVRSSWYAVGDVDGDAANDLVIVEDGYELGGKSIWVSYQRDGELASAEIVEALPEDGEILGGGAIAISDLNLDGRNDIVFTTSAMVALLRTGTGSFRSVAKPYRNSGSVMQDAIAVGDLNCDGCPDAVGVTATDTWVFTGTACARQK